MNRRFALQLSLSLLLGGALCTLAMWDWRWGDMVDSVRPLGDRTARLVLPAQGGPPPGTPLTLRLDRHPVATLVMPEAPAAGWGELESLPADLRGLWQLHGPDGPVHVLMARHVLHCGYILCFREAHMEPGYDWETDRALPAGSYTLEIEDPAGVVQSHAVVIEVGRTTRLAAPSDG